MVRKVPFVVRGEEASIQKVAVRRREKVFLSLFD